MKSFYTYICIYIFFIGSSTATSQQLIIDSLLYKKSYKKIRLLIPESQGTDTVKHRNVLFMLDGQNLFDAKTSFSGEWEVDEAVLALPLDSQPIVIGIDHGDAARINELTPYVHSKYGGGDADFLLSWIDKELIPYLNKAYSIKTETSHTAIAGSSLGGLFSHYAILKRPDLFTHAGILSPSYWYSEDIYTDTEKYLSDHPLNFYISGGTNEDETLVSKLKQMQTLLSSMDSVSVDLNILQDGSHNEAQWRVSFPQFLSWWINRMEE